MDTLTVAVFVASSCLVLLVGLLVSGGESRLAVRLRELVGTGESTTVGRHRAGPFTTQWMPAIAAPLVPEDEAEKGKLQVRLIHAGLYGRHALTTFAGIRVCLTTVPLALGLLAAAIGLAEWTLALIGASVFAILGYIAPSFWLDRRKAKRQNLIRRALPDAMDMIVVCLDGGLSPVAALDKVAGEMHLAYPLIASELRLVIRGSELGQSTGESLQQFAGRFDLEELRRLASMVMESDRFGTSVGKILRVHAGDMRVRRHQMAEEMARKAAVQLLFPTVVFILPCIFVVVLAPSAIHIIRILNTIGSR